MSSKEQIQRKDRQSTNFVLQNETKWIVTISFYKVTLSTVYIINISSTMFHRHWHSYALHCTIQWSEILFSISSLLDSEIPQFTMNLYRNCLPRDPITIWRTAIDSFNDHHCDPIVAFSRLFPMPGP